MKYTPGLHILVEFTSEEHEKLYSFEIIHLFFDSLINKYKLAKVGEVYHNFENGGFTAVVCLTESHLSIHTWPEFKLVTFDIFLSNYLKDNHQKVNDIYEEVISFFKGQERQKTTLTR